MRKSRFSEAQIVAIVRESEAEGVTIFVKAFDNLLHHLESKAAKLAA